MDLYRVNTSTEYDIPAAHLKYQWSYPLPTTMPYMHVHVHVQSNCSQTVSPATSAMASLQLLSTA